MNFLNNIIKNLFLGSRFFFLGGIIIFIFVVAFFLPFFYIPAQLLFFVLLIFTFFDIWILFNTSKGIDAQRKLAYKLSNGDKNQIDLHISNYYRFKVSVEIIDEIPPEFQIRDFGMKTKLKAGEVNILQYYLRPTFRGLVNFGFIHIYSMSPIGLIKRRFYIDASIDVPIYPSIINMRRYDLAAITHKLQKQGFKKVRRLGHTMEFEKIKEYVTGDDFRTVNWKATAKTSKLMVNQYQDEKSQSVYCIIDKGRLMKMPFDGLSLLDYAINTCLVICNTVLKKQDYAGFFSFSRKIDNRVVADRKGAHLNRIIEALFNVRTDFFESDYGKLYADVKKNISHRSLLLLFTNFETMDGLNRQITYLKALAKNHLLIVIIFQNTELESLISDPAVTTQEIFDKIIAEKFAFEKKLIVTELRKYGIQCLLTKPENLTIDAINKYLEIKARGMI